MIKHIKTVAWNQPKTTYFIPECSSDRKPVWPVLSLPTEIQPLQRGLPTEPVIDVVLFAPYPRLKFKPVIRQAILAIRPGARVPILNAVLSAHKVGKWFEVYYLH
jgi:hypothetical protein